MPLEAKNSITNALNWLFTLPLLSSASIFLPSKAEVSSLNSIIRCSGLEVANKDFALPVVICDSFSIVLTQ